MHRRRFLLPGITTCDPCVLLKRINVVRPDIQSEVNGERRLVWVPASSLDEYGDVIDDDLGGLVDVDGDFFVPDEFDDLEDLDNFVILADENYADYLYDDNITSCNKVRLFHNITTTI